MAAPKGNQFWKLRSKHGRDKLFGSPDLLWEAACEYFEWVQNNPLLEEQIVNKSWTETIPIGPNEDGNEKYSKITHPYSIAELNKMRPFTMEGLCHYLDCNKGYFNDFYDAINQKSKEEKIKEDKDFSVILIRIREVVYRQKFEGAASGFLNANLIARDLGLSDKVKNENTNINHNTEVTKEEAKEISQALEDEC